MQRTDVAQWRYSNDGGHSTTRSHNRNQEGIYVPKAIAAYHVHRGAS